MGSGAIVAMICIAVIQVILIFAVLKIKEGIDELNGKISKSNEYLLKIKDNTKE
jgi:cell division protein FtsL